MLNNAIASRITRPLARAGLHIAKHSPKILTGAGVAGVVAAGVMASGATLKAVPVIDKAQEDLQLIRDNVAAADLRADRDYSREDHISDLTKVYTRTTVALVKLYAPAFIVGGLSIASIVYGHRILSKRNAALTAAYAATDKAFKKYREQVEGLLEDSGISLEVRETKTDADGNSVENVAHVSPGGYSQYARFFDEGNRNWEKNAEWNHAFLSGVQMQCNDLLHAQGHIFLNEVYDRLGIQRSQAGVLVGWVLGGDGDSYVDFGLYNGSDEKKRDFVNGYERSVLLDFNVDGVIYDKI